MRTYTFGIFLLMSMGSGMELLLLDHFEDVWQMVPLIFLGLGVLLILHLQLQGSDVGIRLFRICMYASILSGLLGLYFHFKANWEFELEINPSYEGFKLLYEVLKGAIPALAPGTMVALGFLGFLYLKMTPPDTQKTI